MIRRIVLAALAIALGGCATTDPGYRQAHRDGSYRGAYDGGYYAESSDGYGDYYYDRPQLIVNEYYGGYGYPYGGFGFGSPWQFGYGSRFGYDPWFRDPWFGYGWYRPWPRHHHHPPGRVGVAAAIGSNRRDVQAQAGPVSVNDTPRRIDHPYPVRDQQDSPRGRDFDGPSREPRHDARERQLPRNGPRR